MDTIMAGIDIITVQKASELKDFIDLPWKIYGSYPKWVPPLKKEVGRLLETVGRIAGVIDRNYNQFHGEKMGIWGFFECTDDQDAAAALFSSVETWVWQKGMTFIRGPLNPSTNYEVGLLIEGFDYPPALMMTYNPPYYPKLVESCGFAKEKDLLAFLIDGNYQLPEWMDSLAGRIARKKGIHIKHLNPKDADAEFALIRDIYNDSWSSNWGFVPLSNNEMRDIQKNVMKFADPDLAFFINYENEPAAVCVIFPDINPLLKRFNGHIGVMGLLKAILYRKEIKGMRLLIFGIKEKYRQMGIPMLAFHHIYDIARKQDKYRSLELGWTLESIHW